MRCPTCGKQLPNDPYYCAYCGGLIKAVSAPMPRLALDARSMGLALAGIGACLPMAVAFWLAAGQLVAMPFPARLALGTTVAALAGGLGTVVRGQVRWPLAAQPPRCSARQLGLAYGLGGGLSVVLGALLVGALVTPLGWGLAAPDLPSALAGATSGLVGAAFAVPPALLVGAVAGEVLGRLAAHGPPAVAAWAAALAWWLAGSAGGAVAGVFVAQQSNYSVALGAALGALIQSALQIVLLPAAAGLIRFVFVLFS